jgi:hypothetical protein
MVYIWIKIYGARPNLILNANLDWSSQVQIYKLIHISKRWFKFNNYSIKDLERVWLNIYAHTKRATKNIIVINLYVKEIVNMSETYPKPNYSE